MTRIFTPPTIVTLLILAAVIAPVPSAFADGEEEFVGPFSSWRDLRRDYGAVGDGKADETAALQRALDELTKHQKFCVLYIPAGTYRLTQTVKTIRKAHEDCQGVAIVGEDPTTTVLLWDGPKDGVMFQWDAWYSKISRLTLDGAKRAANALVYGPTFSTYNETSDLHFRDVGIGLALGTSPKTNGQAENAVVRCQFLRCDVGVRNMDWNSMDIWLWNCLFEDSGRGVYAYQGNYNVWQCLFLRSRIVDLSTQNLMTFSVVNNTSIGSARFFDFATGHTWGSQVSITGNRVLDPTGDWAVMLGNAGPFLVVDNVFRLSEKTRGIKMTWGDQSLIGNTYTRKDAVEENGRFRRIAEKVVEAKEIPGDLPILPKTPALVKRKIFEVPSGGSGEDIQKAIDEAVKLAGQRPVVHLPMGTYKIQKTIVIPAGADVQVVGDSVGETTVRLNWAGPSGGPVFRLEGPSRASLSEFMVNATGSRIIVVEKADQPGGRIFADQLNAIYDLHAKEGGGTALRIDGLQSTDVLLRSLQGSGNDGSWVEVIGGPQAATAKNQISILTGAASSAVSQYSIKKGGRLVVRAVYHEQSSSSLKGLDLADEGVLSVDATRFSYATSPTRPTIALRDFRGMLTIASSLFVPVGSKEPCRFEITGDGSKASVLALNNMLWVFEPGWSVDTLWQNKAQPPAKGGMIGCIVNTSNREAAPKLFQFVPNAGDHPDPAKSKFGSGPVENKGNVDDATILRHVEPLRTCRIWQPASAPAGVTDVRIHRLMLRGGSDCVVEFRGK